MNSSVRIVEIGVITMAMFLNCQGIVYEGQEEIILNALKEVCEQDQLFLDMNGTEGKIYVCPNGVISVKLENHALMLSTNAALVGPGYHVYVVKLYEKLQHASEVYVAIDDEAEYLEDEDFQRLVDRYYDPYMSALITNMASMKEDDMATYGWDEKSYLPIAKEGKIITVLGYLQANELKSLTLTQAKQRYYIWNKIEKDACFFRNSALVSLWCDCLYENSLKDEGSLKLAQSICQALEKAHQLDPQLPLPVDEYQLLCQVLNRKNQIFDVDQYPDTLIGYRRQPVLYVYGNWLILEEGTAVQNFDGNTMILTNYQDDEVMRLLKITGYKASDPIDHYASRYLNTVNALDTFDFESDNIRGRGVVHELNDEEHLLYLQAQLICDKETLMISCECADMNQVAKAKELLQMILYESHERSEINVSI